MKNNVKKTLNNRQGQSMVEYIILLAVIIAALIIFLGRGGVFEQTYNSMVGNQGADMSNVSRVIFF